MNFLFFANLLCAYLVNSFTCVLNLLTAVNHYCEGTIVFPVVRVLAFSEDAPPDMTPLRAGCLIFIFLLFVHLYHQVLHHHWRYRRYVQQSGDYAQSKNKFRNAGKRAALDRVARKVEEKRRSGKKIDAPKYDTIREKLRQDKAKYEPHSGFFAYYTPGSLLGAMRELITPRSFRIAKSECDRYSAQYGDAVTRVLHDIPTLSTAFERSKMCFSSFKLSQMFDANNVENTCTLVAGLMTSHSIVNASALLLSHFKIYYNQSVAVELANFFSRLVASDTYEQQSVEAAVELWRTLCSDFKALKKSPLFDKLVGVVSLLVSSGLCSSFNLDFKVGGFDIFNDNLKARIEGVSLFDIPQLVLETVAYFLETGYLCYTQGSLRPILFSTPEAFEHEKKYLEFYRVYPLAFDGDWQAAGMDYLGFVALYTDLYNYMHGLHSVLRQGFEKKVLWDRLVKLVQSKNTIDRRVNAGVMRKAPFVLAFAGTSSVGKTSIANILNVVAVKACGGTGDLSKKVTFNENDEYFSGYKVDTETIVMDDLCNTKPNFLQGSPLANLIKFNNNNPEYAVMADLESKGAIPIRPLTIVITTNVPDLMASVYSNEPVSILRRLNVRITVKVKPEFAKVNQHGGAGMMDSDKANAYVAGLPESERIFPDLWHLKVEVVVPKKNPTSGLPDTAEWCVVFWNKMFLEDVSLRTVAEYIAEAAGAHAANQEAMVSKQTLLHETIHLCPVCRRLQHCCSCGLTEQSGASPLYEDPLVPGDVLLPDGEIRPEPELIDDTGQEWYWFIPHRLHVDALPFFRYLCTMRGVWDYIRLNVVTSVLSACYCVQFFFFPIHSTLLAGFLCTWYAFATCTSLYQMYYHFWVMRRRAVAIRERAMRVANHPGFRFAVCCGTTYIMTLAIAKVLRGVIKLYSTCRKITLDGQSALDPGNREEYGSRRSSGSCWSKPLPTVKLSQAEHRAKTTRWQDLADRLEANCVFVQNGTRISGGFFVRTHLLAVPAHFVTDEMKLVIFPRPARNGNNHSYTVKATAAVTYRVPNSDIALIYAPGGTDKYNVTDFLPTNYLDGGCVSTFMYRGSDGKVIRERVTTKFSEVHTNVATFRGFEYVFKDILTFKGLCMGAFISETKTPQVIGFHLGGLTGTGQGAAGTLRACDVTAALSHLSVAGVLFPGSSAPVPVVMYEEHLGEDSFMMEGDIAPRCSTNFLGAESVVDVLGPCKGAVTSKSKVVISHLSDSVTKHTGHMRTHGPAPMGPPDVPRWHNWALGMAGFSTPCEGPNVSEIVRASVDYIRPLLSKYVDLVPLTMDEIVNGLDDDKFLNRMPQNTSVGFPLTGALSKFCQLEPPVEGHQVRYSVDSAILEVYHQYKERYKHGERCYPVFRAVLKDEPVKIGKKKARVFQAAPIALKMILREYFLPIVAHLSMYPLLSECAVGINPFSEEWDEMHHHICAFGEDRIVAGDYSAYDQRMPASLTAAAFSILIELAEKAGYSSESLTIMRAVAADVVYPLIAYNGTLVQLFGSNPSGHNITVYVNSIVNSLISRCAFFSVYPDASDFRSAVSMMTYGDDDIGSVAEDFSAYDNVSKSEYITMFGMKYTPPSKEGDHIPYLGIGEVDFLKRKSTYNITCHRYMGALEIESIMKSLHVRIPSRELSDEQWAGSVVDGALREMFAHGEGDYEVFRQQMIQVAEDCGFSPHSQNLLCEYSEMREKIES